MKVTYFEGSDSLFVDMEMDPERKVGRVRPLQLNEHTLVNRDEAGNIWSIEIMSHARRLYGTGGITVEGLPASVLPPPDETPMSVEEFAEQRDRIMQEQREPFGRAPK